MTSGNSTVSTLCGWAIEEQPGLKPIDFTVIHRVDEIGGVGVTSEVIDASALEDYEAKYIIGRADPGQTIPITVHMTKNTKQEWQTLFDDFKNRASEDLRMWLEVYTPHMDDSFYLIVEPPEKVVLPDIGQNQLFLVEVNFIIKEYIGYDNPVKPMPPMFYLYQEDDLRIVDEEGRPILVYLEIED
jgi:hypothetical protein